MYSYLPWARLRIEDAVFNVDGARIISCDFSDRYHEWSTETGQKIEHEEDNGAVLASQMQSLVAGSNKAFRVKCLHAEITVKRATGSPVFTFTNVSGLLVQGCDFWKVDPASVFSDTVRKSLRSYGAIFDDGDESTWKRAIK